jgi:outer membrane protein assembly factor BamA
MAGIGPIVILGQAQSKSEVKWVAPSPLPVHLPGMVSDSLDLLRKSQRVVYSLQAEGFLLAHATIEWTQRPWTVHLHLGDMWQWVKLSSGNLPADLLSKAGYRERMFSLKPFRHQEFARLTERILSLSEQSGYPFASLRLDSLHMHESSISASLSFASGPFITFDTLTFSSNAGVEASFMMYHLGIRPGQPYNQRLVDELDQKLKSLPFLKVIKPSEVVFRLDQAEVVLHVEKRKSSRFDGILGFLPNELEQGRLLLTGQVDIALANLGGKGRALDMEWQRLRPLSQTLTLGYRHPYVLGSALSPSGSFFLLREDSTFINRRGSLELAVGTGGRSELQFLGEVRSARRLEGAGTQERVGDLADFNFTGYGLRYLLARFDDPFFPRKGWGVRATLTGGNKRILRNASLDESFYELYPTRSFQWQAQLAAQGFIRLGRYAVWSQEIQAGIIENKHALFLNDLDRLGGLGSIRGFNENNFFASRHVVYRSEWRWYFEENSYFLGFFDQGLVGYSLREAEYYDQPAGVGGGLAILTNGGQLTLLYALGWSRLQPFAPNLSKIHFGYVARF